MRKDDDHYRASRHDTMKMVLAIDSTLTTLQKTAKKADLCMTCLFHSTAASLLGTMVEHSDMPEDEFREFMGELTDLIVSRMKSEGRL